MNTVIGIFSLISALLTVAHFIDHPIDMEAVKAHLSTIKQWFITGDIRVAITLALIIGLSLVGIASWLRWVMV